MVLKSRDNANYNERVKRDLDILKTAHELGIADAEESGEPVTFPEDLERDQLVKKILNTRGEAVDSIKCCNSPDIADITQGFLDELLEINLFTPWATKEINDLHRRADQVEHEIPVRYSLSHPATMSMLMFIPVKLRDLGELCSLYQEKFGIK